MTVPTPQMTEPRADGPTSTNRLPTATESKFQTRVEFDNYKASYLRM